MKKKLNIEKSVLRKLSSLRQILAIDEDLQSKIKGGLVDPGDGGGGTGGQNTYPSGCGGCGANCKCSCSYWCEAGCDSTCTDYCNGCGAAMSPLCDIIS